MASNPPPSKGTIQLGKVVGGTAIATALIGTVAMFEGKSNDPYFDLVHRATVCYGETNVAMQHYTDAQCKDMLATSLIKYAEPVLAANPELQGHPNQIIAATSLTYNIGPANYRRSSVSKDFRAGHWVDACNAFLNWSYAGGRRVAGLLHRREVERDLCLKGL